MSRNVKGLGCVEDSISFLRGSIIRDTLSEGRGVVAEIWFTGFSFESVYMCAHHLIFPSPAHALNINFIKCT